ncbi:MAG: hypothetical protein SGBAC_010727 [Bacillariaceae sp.]
MLPRTDMSGSSAALAPTSAPVTLEAYDNAALVGTPIEEIVMDYDSTVSIPGMVSVRITGCIQVASPTKPPSSIRVDCATQKKTQQNDSDEVEDVPGFFWLDDHLVCQSGFYNITQMQMDGTIHTPILVSPRRTEWVLYGEFWPQNEHFSLTHSVADIKSVSSATQETRSIFGQVKTTISPLEKRRIRLVQQLQNGWGLYNHNSLQEAILLPEGIRLKWEVCSSSELSSCDQSPKLPTTVRPLVASVTPGRKNGDIMEYEVVYPAQNVTLRVLHRFGPDDRMELTFHSTSAPINGYLRVSADVAYFPARRGSVATSSSSITVSATGLRSFTFCACGIDESSDFPSKHAVQSNGITIPVPPNGHSFTVRGFDSTEMDANERDCKTEEMRYATLIQYHLQESRLAAVSRGIDAAIYYNLIYTPAERTLIAPVSRGWGRALCMPALLPEFEYVLFDWGE